MKCLRTSLINRDVKPHGSGAGQSFLKGAALISLGNFSAKVLGALFRIPLTGILGAEGVGLYQLAYPFYCLLLTLASSGLPSGISRIVAKEIKEGGTGRSALKSALKLFFIVGMGGTILMFSLRNVLSDWQGEPLASGYIALCPAVGLVAMLSVFRGYFQGRCNMLPTAVSEVTEQLVKGSFSLVLASFFAKDTLSAVTAVLFSVSVSEGVALFVMYLTYRRERVEESKTEIPCPGFGHILSLTLPVAAAAAVLPFSQFIDSRICVHLLKKISDEGVSLFGLYEGGAMTLIGLPVAVCYGLAASIIPRLQGEDTKKKTIQALSVTLLLAVPCAVVLFFFARSLGGLFFRNLQDGQLDILARLIRISSPIAVTHACAQTLAACLIGKGRAGRAAVNMGLAATVKIVVVCLTVGRENIGIYGMAIAANICYFLAFVLNLICNFKKRGEKT